MLISNDYRRKGEVNDNGALADREKSGNGEPAQYKCEQARFAAPIVSAEWRASAVRTQVLAKIESYSRKGADRKQGRFQCSRLFGKTLVDKRGSSNARPVCCLCLD